MTYESARHKSDDSRATEISEPELTKGEQSVQRRDAVMTDRFGRTLPQLPPVAQFFRG